MQQTLSLVELAKADDLDATEELFARYLPRVRRLAAIRMGKMSRELFDVDDITQETLTDAFRNIQRFEADSDGAFTNWLAKLVENRILMALRAGRTAKRGGGNVRRFADASETVHTSRMAGSDATPSQHAAGSEVNEQMERALLKMSEGSRELILHRFVCHMSYQEIVELTDYDNADVVRAMYNRALKEMRELIRAMRSSGE